MIINIRQARYDRELAILTCEIMDGIGCDFGW